MLGFVNRSRGGGAADPLPPMQGAVGLASTWRPAGNRLVTIGRALALACIRSGMLAALLAFLLASRATAAPRTSCSGGKRSMCVCWPKATRAARGRARAGRPRRAILRAASSAQRGCRESVPPVPPGVLPNANREPGASLADQLTQSGRNRPIRPGGGVPPGPGVPPAVLPKITRQPSATSGCRAPARVRPWEGPAGRVPILNGPDVGGLCGPLGAP